MAKPWPSLSRLRPQALPEPPIIPKHLPRLLPRIRLLTSGRRTRKSFGAGPAETGVMHIPPQIYRPDVWARRTKGSLLPISVFHLHLVSDATGETLIAVSRAVVAQFDGIYPMEHLYPMVRSRAQIEKAIGEIGAAPGLVLYTLVDQALSERLESACRDGRRALPFRAAADSGSFPILSRHAGDAAPRRAAHAELRLFQAHRRFELYDDA